MSRVTSNVLPLPIVDSAASSSRSPLEQVGDTAGEVGRTAWDHKSEIGLWVGTAALLLGIPLHAGGSASRIGSVLLSRGSRLTGRVAGMGPMGATAAGSARAGVAAIRDLRTTFDATRTGAAVTNGLGRVRAARVAFGETRVGSAMISAQRPVTVAATVLAGVNLADTSRRFAKGEASAKDLALSTLGFMPIGLGGVQAMAARRAASVSQQAASTLTKELGQVTAQATAATGDAAHVARLAPTIRAPRTADAAADAHANADATVRHATRLHDLASGTSSTDAAVSASRLHQELELVADRAAAGRHHAAAAQRLAPPALAPAARAAHAQLHEAVEATDRLRTDIAGLAQSQQQADRVAGQAEVVKDAVGATALHAGNINNSVIVSHEQSRSGLTTSDSSLINGLTSWLLGRNARMAAPASVPPPRLGTIAGEERAG